MRFTPAATFACLISLSLASPAAAQDNKPPAGFVALFNGKDLTGWQGLVELPQRAKLTPEELKKAQQDANDKFLPHWTVRDGVLHYDGKGQSLQTAKDYQDFELLVDWKIGPKGDTGIYLRGTPQVQIWDRAEGSGGLYNNQKNPRNPSKNADKPVGEWNTFRIEMRGEIVNVWLNGELVVDKVPMENYWDRTKPIAPTGPIELQHHGNPIEFKNIYIRELK
jgi:Domain of Unknown Function (DUF1080)